MWITGTYAWIQSLSYQWSSKDHWAFLKCVCISNVGVDSYSVATSGFKQMSLNSRWAHSEYTRLVFLSPAWRCHLCVSGPRQHEQRDPGWCSHSKRRCAEPVQNKLRIPQHYRLQRISPVAQYTGASDYTGSPGLDYINCLMGDCRTYSM